MCMLQAAHCSLNKACFLPILALALVVIWNSMPGPHCKSRQYRSCTTGYMKVPDGTPHMPCLRVCARCSKLLLAVSYPYAMHSSVALLTPMVVIAFCSTWQVLAVVVAAVGTHQALCAWQQSPRQWLSSRSCITSTTLIHPHHPAAM